MRERGETNTAGSSYLPWAAAAAIFIATGVSLFVLRAPPGGLPSGVVRSHFIESGARAGIDTEVPVPRSVTGFQLVLRVDGGPDQLPLQLEVLDDEGLVVIRERGISHVFRDAYLFFHASRDDFPDGRYVIQVAPESDPSSLQKFRLHVYTAD